MRVTLGYSPCPNDTFVFCGLVHGHIAGAPECEEVLADIETLNEMALRGNSTRPKYPSTRWRTCGRSTAFCTRVVPWGGDAGRYW